MQIGSEYTTDDEKFRKENPMAEFLRMDRMPHIWCPGCGIGTVVTCFAEAIKAGGYDMDKIAVVSGIGCTGRVAGYVKFDSFHTTHGRAIPFATGLKLANPELKVVVISGDGDLTSIGGNHLIHAARRNMDLMVICVNNFTYGMTGGQVTPTTPTDANASTTPTVITKRRSACRSWWTPLARPWSLAGHRFMPTTSRRPWGRR